MHPSNARFWKKELSSVTSASWTCLSGRALGLGASPFFRGLPLLLPPLPEGKLALSPLCFCLLCEYRAE